MGKKCSIALNVSAAVLAMTLLLTGASAVAQTESVLVNLNISATIGGDCAGLQVAGRCLAPLVKTRAFGMTPSVCDYFTST